MIALIIFLAAMFAALAAGAMGALSDWRGLVIPNAYSAAVGASFLVCYALLWALGHEGVFAGFGSHILACLLIFGVTAGLYAAKLIGAADSKLASVYALWAGLPGLPAFLFYMTLAGGILGLAALALARWKPVKNPAPGGWVARAQGGENKVPYGVAIVLGALACFVKLGYLGADTLSSFLG